MRAIVLAAGKGTRLCGGGSKIPKAMYRVCGRPLLEAVLENTAFIPQDDTYIVVGYKKESIIGHFGNSYHYIEQKEQLGTGHAVRSCADAFEGYDGTVLVAFGDMPLFRYESMKAMCEYHEKSGAACTLLTAENPLLDDWAKIIRDENGDFSAIVEGSDCVGEQKNITELFAGVLAFDSGALFEYLPMLTSDNVQNEYYLTQLPEIMAKAGLAVATFPTDDPEDLYGINRPEDIEKCERVMLKRKELLPV